MVATLTFRRTSMSTTTLETVAPGRALRIGLWAAQVVLAFVFISAGFVKLTTPIPQLAAMMPWAGQYSETFVRSIALVDLAGGIGILLPALTRILPRLTVLAALGCAVLQVIALLFHLSRGEAAVTPLNVVLLALALFVLWGRNGKAPIAPRQF
ncbi:putative membrane protein YphA (DoxX/SURF4 family) [Bradyrhizobium huanghuaihaiense]|uniref:DoxX-like protein n=2 Tax=Bradyrhizobium huanghuaihaiense TaxID=990078 RepID=A0A562QXS1_9BRAD|nr:DoxX-like protein [Bradyrhizobium huanghuaihaiense]